MTRVIRAAIGAMAVAGLLVLAACGGEPGRDEIVDSLLKGGLDRPVAECVADAFAELPDEDRRLIAERGSSGVRDDRDDDEEPIDIARRKMSECRNVAPALEAETDELVPAEESDPADPADPAD